MTLQPPKPIVYVTRDMERALGMEPKGGYFVISNDGKFGREIQKKYPYNVKLIKNERVLDTFDLLVLDEVQKIISDKKAGVLVFQNTGRIERLAKEKGLNLLNPSSTLAKKVEEKISQVVWLGPLSKLLPPYEIVLVKDVRWSGEKFVIQFNHSHTGQGTFIINSAPELKVLTMKFPNRECKVSKFIDGPVFTVNAVVADRVLVGNPSYQITGLPPFTDLQFSTIGNDFALPHDPKYKKVYRETCDMASHVGSKLGESGWKGLFGIDVIYDEKTGQTYLLEINARQPASAVFESWLQKKSNSADVSIFEAHIAALLQEPTPQESSKGTVTNISKGSQIVKRVTKKVFEVDIASLLQKDFDVIEYENSSNNKELFRIQSSEGIMKSHGKFNDLGNFIKSCIR